ncbi:MULTISPECIES: AraC family transcriptional regulator [unclassified Streptomyces]|uniref:AraC family transcriptional regulator n=1 Tax=unclassified Streptomyces TaxID=2593676 RepID=UPI000DB9F43C|nr:MULTISPECIES: AraC family transcriptional regulator [unclassified Streptomyces]MYT69653.1 helix-turn-helix domain-containing protein [Streptomyces sp. SID8367]RAJ70717.1 AraC-like DNA-binding protein [Streptomyces sp. PsTaAH-137]
MADMASGSTTTLHSRDVDAARTQLTDFYGFPVVPDPELSDIGNFSMTMRCVRLGPVAFNTLAFGAATALHGPAPLPRIYPFFAAMTGTMTSTRRGTDTHSTAGDGRLASAVSAHPQTITSGPGNEYFTASFARAAVTAELEEELGHGITELAFPTSFAAVSGQARTFKALLDLLTSEIVRPTGLLDRPSAAYRLGATLLTTMLHTTPHQYAEKLATPGRTGPAPVRTVTEAIHADPAHPFTARELARISGIPLRTLQTAFRDHHGIPMTVYLRNVRLAGAHRDLRAERAPGTTVASVAARWGFTHLSRFALYYRDRYGVLPSEQHSPSRPPQ